MLTLPPLEVDAVFTPGMQVRNDLERLPGPRVKRMGNLERPAQTVRINSS
jgi:hypothetical protein